MRTTEPSSREPLFQAMERYAQRQADAFDRRAEVALTPGEPALINDDALASGCRKWLTVLGERWPNRCAHWARTTSRSSPRRSSLMLFVGVESTISPSSSLHDPRFLPPDAAVGEVARAMLAGWLAAAGSLGDGRWGIDLLRVDLGQRVPPPARLSPGRLL